MKTALVVDDSVWNRESFSKPLESLGFKVLQASNGQEALAIVKKTNLQVIFLDHYMPIMSGLEFLEALRKDLPEFSTPVIMMSTTESINRRAVAEKGAWDWIEKPPSLADIKAVLQRVNVLYTEDR